MDRSEKPLPTRHRRNNPSFSSSLLDSIYRSMDESDGNNLTATGPTPTALKTQTAINYNYYSSSTSTSTSSSDADSTRTLPIRTGRVLTRSEQIRSNPPPPPPPQPNPKISLKKKLRDLKNKSTSPVSPGAKLAGFLNSLFSAASSSHKKPKISSSSSPSPSMSNCSSASSCSRSCLSKTPSTRGSGGVVKRSVRFSPVVGEKTAAEKAVVVEREMERRRRLMEEIMKGFQMEIEESDNDGDESDGDLFELTDLGGRFIRDELPVYGTTDLGINSVITRGIMLV